MHCADLGIGADWLGQLMVFMLDWMNGNTRKERINDLWGRIQALYPNYPGGSRLDNLTEKMLSLDKPSPKLKAYAAECRGLVPIMSTLASQLLDATDPVSVQAIDSNSSSSSSKSSKSSKQHSLCPGHCIACHQRVIPLLQVPVLHHIVSKGPACPALETFLHFVGGFRGVGGWHLQGQAKDAFVPGAVRDGVSHLSHLHLDVQG